MAIPILGSCEKGLNIFMTLTQNGMDQSSSGTCLSVENFLLGHRGPQSPLLALSDPSTFPLPIDKWLMLFSYKPAILGIEADMPIDHIVFYFYLDS